MLFKDWLIVLILIKYTIQNKHVKRKSNKQKIVDKENTSKRSKITNVVKLTRWRKKVKLIAQFWIFFNKISEKKKLYVSSTQQNFFPIQFFTLLAVKSSVYKTPINNWINHYKKIKTENQVYEGMWKQTNIIHA